jgi:hypothetical protein
MRGVPWGMIVLPGLEMGAPVSLSREAKAEAPAVIAYMGTTCSVCESTPREVGSEGQDRSRPSLSQGERGG